MEETLSIDKKSLKIVTGSTANWDELAKDCVCFANAKGGKIVIGIENNEQQPPSNQIIVDTQLPSKIHKRISELTINVAVNASIVKSENGGEYIEVKILPSISTIAGTTDGKYYLRVSDTCKPVMPDELTRLFADKSAFIWETQIRKTTTRFDVDSAKLSHFISDVKSSDRVSSFVKDKSADELLEHYLMLDNGCLTNLGVLWVGKRTDRAKLLYPPVIQFLKFDENGNKVNKMVWDDFSLNPKDLIEAVWTQIPDWKEGIEISDGIFRKFIPNYEEEVIRELIANALVHRPYTTRGDIFINLYPDKLEIHNPGLFPLGIYTSNILHKTIRRNEHLAKVFYDLRLMEREGTGYDKMYEVLLANGKQIPEPLEGDDRISVTIRKRILKTEVVKLIQRANDEFNLRQKEVICLGLIAQHSTLSALEFSKILSLNQPNAIRDWLGRLLELGIVKSKGKTKGVEYFVNPVYLKLANFKGKTNLKQIETHRLRELIIEDIRTFPDSTLVEIHERVGKEIKEKKLRDQLKALIEAKQIKPSKGRKYRTYSLFS